MKQMHRNNNVLSNKDFEALKSIVPSLQNKENENILLFIENGVYVNFNLHTLYVCYSNTEERKSSGFYVHPGFCNLNSNFLKSLYCLGFSINEQEYEKFFTAPLNKY